MKTVNEIIEKYSYPSIDHRDKPALESDLNQLIEERAVQFARFIKDRFNISAKDYESEEERKKHWPDWKEGTVIKTEELYAKFLETINKI